MENQFVPVRCTATDLRQAFQDIFEIPEMFAMISALTNALIDIRRIDKKDPPVMSLHTYTCACLAKVLSGLPADLKAQAIEGLNESGFSVELKEVTMVPQGVTLQ